MTTSRSASVHQQSCALSRPYDSESDKEQRAVWAPIFMPSSWRSWRPCIHFCEGFLQKSTHALP